jgi:hypothetical protein
MDEPPSQLDYIRSKGRSGEASGAGCFAGGQDAVRPMGALLAADPETYYITGHYRDCEWMQVRHPMHPMCMWMRSISYCGLRLARN